MYFMVCVDEEEKEGYFKREHSCKCKNSSNALVKIDFHGLAEAKSNKWRVISKEEKRKGGCK